VTPEPTLSGPGLFHIVKETERHAKLLEGRKDWERLYHLENDTFILCFRKAILRAMWR
jgi:hypothetical protein